MQNIEKTRKARKDTMPHERSLTPVLPIEFSSIALADRKFRRRDLTAYPTALNSCPA